jgi:nickel/cobalt exporter
VPAPATSTSVAPRRHDSDSFASLMTLEHLTRARMGWLLLLAAGLGGLHALSPGHGKTLVAAYLVGSRGTAWHALALGMIVTCTHTAGVFALGLVTLFASHYLLPETLYPWLTAVSGLVIAQIGLLRLFGRGGLHPHVHGDEHLHEHEHGMVHSHADVHQDRPAHAHVHGGHVHAHAHVETGHSHPSLSQDEHQHHEHEHAHGHHHHHHLPMAGEAITWRSLLALGVSGGLVPCPSALVVLLSAIALHRIGFGLALIVAFSAGLAVVLTAIGIAMVCARDFLSNRFALPPWLLGLVPRVGAALITVIGLAIALPAVLLLARRY